MPAIKTPDLPAYMQEVDEVLVEFSANRAKDSIQNAFVALVASEATTIAAETIVELVLVSAVTTIGPEVIAAGGATAGAAVAGATTGSVGGPAGAAIGIAVGLILGVAVDWYLTDRFEAKTIEDLNQYLTELRDGLVEGSGSSEAKGLRELLRAFTEELTEAEERVMHNAIVGVNQ